MSDSVPVAVVIPTYNRGFAVLSTLRRIYACDPRPEEVLVHIDATDGILEAELARQYPEVRALTSPTRLGPGGGRHRCLSVCKAPYAASFDDDSYPVDNDFFYRVEQIFSQHPRAAVIGASIWHRNDPPKSRNESLLQTPSFTGCGHAIRLAAYRQVRGYLPRPVPYGMEENDVSLQLFAADWQIYEARDLRVYPRHRTKASSVARNHIGIRCQRRPVCVLELSSNWLGLGPSAASKHRRLFGSDGANLRAFLWHFKHSNRLLSQSPLPKSNCVENGEKISSVSSNRIGRNLRLPC